MKPPDLDRLLCATPRNPADFADAIMAKLPGMRFVIPGSHPGLRILGLAAVLGLLTAAGVSLGIRQARPASKPEPPPLTLFQPGAVEPLPAPVSP